MPYITERICGAYRLRRQPENPLANVNVCRSQTASRQRGGQGPMFSESFNEDNGGWRRRSPQSNLAIAVRGRSPKLRFLNKSIS